MAKSNLEVVSDNIKAAHEKVQAKHDKINPVVGLNRQMRARGFPVDVITIDCLQTKNRIILLLDDNEPEIIRYQFAKNDVDASNEYQSLAITELNQNKLYDWMVSYFTV